MIKPKQLVFGLLPVAFLAVAIAIVTVSVKQKTSTSSKAAENAVDFQDSFEGDLSAWQTSISTGCTLTIVTPPADRISPDGGKQLFLMQAQIGQPDCYLTHAITPALIQGKVSLWFFDNVAADNPMELVVAIKDTQGNSLWLGIRTSLNATNYTLKVDANEVDSGVNRAFGWHKFEFYVANGQSYAMIDNVSLHSLGYSINQRSFTELKIKSAWGAKGATRIDGINIEHSDFPYPASLEAPDPQYIFLRKSPGKFDNTVSVWSQSQPDTFNQASIDEIINNIGTRGIANRRIGVAYHFFFYGHYFEPAYDSNIIKHSLQNLLDLSKANDLPVAIYFDGALWQDGHPDLWNWWDPTKTGYDPNNVNNVEWTSWDPASAVKIGWRNWGFQFRVLPQPNLASRALIESNKAELAQYVPLVANWYRDLPPDKKYLLGAVIVDVEANIGVNYFYYPNGNSYVDADPANDPTEGISDAQQLGYAALTTLGLAADHQITVAKLDTVVSKYINEQAQVINSLGIPREKIFDHSGANFNDFPPSKVWNSANAALTNFANPGWSFYGYAPNPAAAPGLSTALDQIGNAQWGQSEWQYQGKDYEGWKSALANGLNYRNNRYVIISNWENINTYPDIIKAIKETANTAPPCWLQTATLNPPVINGGTVTLSWLTGLNSTATYLNVSSINDYNPGGTLKTIDVYNGVVSANSVTLNNQSVRNYYWSVVSDGCSNQKRVASGTYAVGSPPTPPPIPTAPSCRVPMCNSLNNPGAWINDCTPLAAYSDTPRSEVCYTSDNQVTIHTASICANQISYQVVDPSVGCANIAVNDPAWSNPIPFSTTKSLTLSSNPGPKKVCVKFINTLIKNLSNQCGGLIELTSSGSTPTPNPADANSDGVVDIRDYLLKIVSVNLFDFNQVIKNMFK